MYVDCHIFTSITDTIAPFGALLKLPVFQSTAAPVVPIGNEPSTTLDFIIGIPVPIDEYLPTFGKLTTEFELANKN